jgi:hypothetical protein
MVFVRRCAKSLCSTAGICIARCVYILTVAFFKVEVIEYMTNFRAGQWLRDSCLKLAA